MLIGQWEFENVTVKSTGAIDTSNKDQMANFVERLSLQTMDFKFKDNGTFETIRKKEIEEKGKFEINNKILTLDYGKEGEIDDYEIMSITDTTMQLRNAKNMIIDYKKIKN